jgi:phosphomannomutase
MENLEQGMVGPNYIGEVLMAQYADIYRAYLGDQKFHKGTLSDDAYAYLTGEVRLNTETYGRILLRGIAAAGVKVYYFFKPKSRPITTPLASHMAQFLTKKYGQAPEAGATISASHNGLKDQGVKLFGQTGAQLLPEQVQAQIKPFKKPVLKKKNISLSISLPRGPV